MRVDQPLLPPPNHRRLYRRLAPLVVGNVHLLSGHEQPRYVCSHPPGGPNVGTKTMAGVTCGVCLYLATGREPGGVRPAGRPSAALHREGR